MLLSFLTETFIKEKNICEDAIRSIPTLLRRVSAVRSYNVLKRFPSLRVRDVSTELGDEDNGAGVNVGLCSADGTVNVVEVGVPAV